jgi:hypothetical protein
MQVSAIPKLKLTTMLNRGHGKNKKMIFWDRKAPLRNNFKSIVLN